MTPSLPELLNVCEVCKQYGESPVLNRVSFNVCAGEVHALLGGNGAGKSTLVRTIAGLVSPTSGRMALRGESYAPRNKRDAEAAGIDIVQQELNLIPTLTVAENLLLTRLPHSAGIIRSAELHRKARAALDRLALNDIPTDRVVGTLGVGQQQMIEIAAALDRKCQLLILDEPTAALSARESEVLFEWLNRLRQNGVGIIYISHRLDEVVRLSDRVTVMRDGSVAGTYQTRDLNPDQMVALMVGEEPESINASGNFSTTIADPATGVSKPGWALRVQGISGGLVEDVSFEVRPGERLGITGLIGSGRTELLRMIFGADKAVSGTVELPDGRGPRRFTHPSEAVHSGIAMVTEDRKKNGLLLPQSIRTNTSLAAMKRAFSRLGMVRSTAEARAAEKYCESMETRCTSIEQAAGTLSGGNQQKVVIARWLATDARVFLFDEPTRGIDVPARRRIYRLIESLAQEDKAVVIVSSDLEELFENCDRIAVMSKGRLVDFFTRETWSRGQILQASFSRYLDRSETE